MIRIISILPKSFCHFNIKHKTTRTTKTTKTTRTTKTTADSLFIESPP